MLPLLLAGAVSVCQAASEERLAAFPGAEGFGRYASGGRGGKVYHVTTLEDSEDPGTLRHAVMQDEPRTVVFDVAGTIHLKHPLRIQNGNLTLAGQTAPGDGVCIAGRQVSFYGSNTIVRYLRFRIGNEAPGSPDGVGGMDFSNLIMDHCSVSWSVDECCGLYGGDDFTVQWCIFSEALRDAGHSKGGTHGYGAIFGGAHASYHHNLLAHAESRMPRLGPRPGTQTREHLDMRNNVIYNWAGQGCYGGEGMKVNIVNNYYKPGPATPKTGPVSHRIAQVSVRTTEYVTGRHGRPNAWKPMEHVWGRFYVDGNIMEGNDEVTSDNWTKGFLAQIDNSKCDGTFNDSVASAIRLAEPLDAGFVTTHTAAEAFDLVLADVGCSKSRDAVDARIIEETRTGTAKYYGSRAADAQKFPGFIDTQYDICEPGADNPWPVLTDHGVDKAQIVDTDGDGIPDVWEKANGLNPSDPNDGNHSTLSKEGYTNLEVYMNSLVPVRS
ncbi:MAG: pectate lyase [Muribaculaceae bacterium]|nr:pectate lyase [Muribaculaceae bacterium]